MVSAGPHRGIATFICSVLRAIATPKPAPNPASPKATPGATTCCGPADASSMHPACSGSVVTCLARPLARSHSVTTNRQATAAQREARRHRRAEHQRMLALWLLFQALACGYGITFTWRTTLELIGAIVGLAVGAPVAVGVAYLGRRKPFWPFAAWAVGLLVVLAVTSTLLLGSSPLLVLGAAMLGPLVAAVLVRDFPAGPADGPLWTAGAGGGLGVPTCRGCGYLLSGLLPGPGAGRQGSTVAGVCPECGRAFRVREAAGSGADDGGAGSAWGDRYEA